jgi:DNA ligase 1
MSHLHSTLSTQILPRLDSVHYLDGELCAFKDGFVDDFRVVSSAVMNSKIDAKDLYLVLFDLVDAHAVNTGRGLQKYNDRYAHLLSLFQPTWAASSDSLLLKTPLSNVLVVDKFDYGSSEFNQLLQDYNERGWEGLILRSDSVYEGKRSRSIIKMKKFQDAEYTVKDVIIGPMLVKHSDGRSSKYEQVMLSCQIEHDGKVVGVGSGFDIETRRACGSNPDLLIGKLITVQYQNITDPQSGHASLRFPTVKTIHWTRRRQY